MKVSKEEILHIAKLANLYIEDNEVDKYLETNKNNKAYLNASYELKEDILIFELMLTKQKPELVLASKDDFYAFSNKVNSDKEYLKENATGNEDIKLLHYSSAPYISMPVAQ